MNQNPFTGARTFFGYSLLLFLFCGAGWSFLTLPISDESSIKALFGAFRWLLVVWAIIFVGLFLAEVFYKPIDATPSGDKLN